MTVVMRYRRVFAVTGLFVIAVSLSCYFAMRNSVIIWQTQRSSNWLVSQLELEYVKFSQVFEAFYHQAPDITAEDVKTRFGIFESRVKIIATGEEGADLREAAEYPVIQAQLVKAIAACRPLIETLDRQTSPQYLAAKQELASLAMPIHLWSMDFLLHNRTLVSLQRGYYPVMIALLGVFVTGIVLIFMLSRALVRAETLAETERIARRSADDANRAKDTFLAIASHEFKTPLNAILGFSELLLMRSATLTEDLRGQYLRDILASGRHLTRIVNDTLNLSKISTGRLSLEMESVDLRTILHEGLPRLAAAAEQSRIALKAAFPAEPVWIQADPVWIDQAISNIVANAIKFSTHGEIVRLSCQADGDQAVLEIVDHGVGIPADELPQITQAFYQVHNVLDRTKGGLGLGLAIADGVIRAHGGGLTIASQLGQGTTVKITLPVVQPPQILTVAAPALAG